MKIRNIHVAIITLIILFGSIYGFKAIGLWSTESDKTPVKFLSGDLEGEYNPFDIRGSYSFEEISTIFEIDIEVLARAFQLGSVEEAKKMKSKDLESLFEESAVEIGNESVQIFVAIIKGVDIGDADGFLPKTAVDELLSLIESLPLEVRAYLEGHQVDTLINSDAVIETQNVLNDSDQVKVTNSEEENKVNANSTFSQVLDFGITKEQIEAIIDAKLPPLNQSVKNYCTENSLSFSVIKNALNALIQ